MGALGRAALENEAAQPKDVDERLLLADALRDASAPDRKPLKDYPLTERAPIKGC